MLSCFTLSLSGHWLDTYAWVLSDILEYSLHVILQEETPKKEDDEEKIEEVKDEEETKEKKKKKVVSCLTFRLLFKRLDWCTAFEAYATAMHCLGLPTTDVFHLSLVSGCSKQCSASSTCLCICKASLRLTSQRQCCSTEADGCSGLGPS